MSIISLAVGSAEDPELMWASIRYQPDVPTHPALGPDQSTTCETPVHQVPVRVSRGRGFGGHAPATLLATAAPAAAWVEYLWYPITGVAVRSWKTCNACHLALTATGPAGDEHTRG